MSDGMESILGWAGERRALAAVRPSVDGDSDGDSDSMGACARSRDDERRGVWCAPSAGERERARGVACVLQTNQEHTLHSALHWALL